MRSKMRDEYRRKFAELDSNKDFQVALKFRPPMKAAPPIDIDKCLEAGAAFMKKYPPKSFLE